MDDYTICVEFRLDEKVLDWLKERKGTREDYKLFLDGDSVYSLWKALTHGEITESALRHLAMEDYAYCQFYEVLEKLWREIRVVPALEQLAEEAE